MKIYEDRITIIRLIREFFWSQGFVETDTPLAVRYASQEPYLNPVPLTITHPRGEKHRFYLRTSPEYALKKLLCAGLTKIFEIGKCFRDEEDFGGTHNPEFTMIEWYRVPGTYQEIMDEMENLFKYVGHGLKIKDLRFKNRTITLPEKWDRMSMKEVWKKFTSINLDNNLTSEQLSNTARDRGYQVTRSDAYEDIFFKIFLNEIEPHLGLERPVFVYDYPAHMSSLSRLSEVDPRYAERFECYIGGLELCNAFGELTDANEQSRRLEQDKALRQTLGKETWPVDPDFIAALRSGLAPAGGIALGVDRMVVLFTGAKDINEVIFQSVKDQLE